MPELPPIPARYPRCATCGGTTWLWTAEVVHGNVSHTLTPPTAPGEGYARQIELDGEYEWAKTACAQGCLPTAALDAAGAPTDPGDYFGL